jgi:3-phosphoshikimate 1-carboxyvinyltransferase
VAHTRAALEAMGMVVEGDQVAGGDLHEPDHVLNVGNSGTGMRLLAGWCSARPWLTVLQGDASVARRPMDRVVGPLRQMGASIDGRADGHLPPLVIRGGDLKGIDYTLPVPSGQVKGAVLLAGVGAEGETVVREPESVRAHTEELLALAGAEVRVAPGQVSVRPSRLRPFVLDVPGDPSQAAFWVVAACITPGSDVVIEDVYLGPGRRGFLDVLLRMGADLEVRGNRLRARASVLRATEVRGREVSGVIDEIPVLAVAAALAEGTTTFADAAELKVKESDRVATTVALLSALGARAESRPDGIVVHGGRLLRGGEVDAAGDHRIAMAAAVAGMAAVGETTVHGWEAVATSYPGFEGVVASCPS